MYHEGKGCRYQLVLLLLILRCLIIQFYHSVAIYQVKNIFLLIMHQNFEVKLIYHYCISIKHCGDKITQRCFFHEILVIRHIPESPCKLPIKKNFKIFRTRFIRFLYALFDTIHFPYDTIRFLHDTLRFQQDTRVAYSSYAFQVQQCASRFVSFTVVTHHCMCPKCIVFKTCN